MKYMKRVTYKLEPVIDLIVCDCGTVMKRDRTKDPQLLCEALFSKHYEFEYVCPKCKKKYFTNDNTIEKIYYKPFKKIVKKVKL